MVTHFDHGMSVYSHNQLYGKWYTVRPDQDPRTNRQLRFAVRTDHRDALLYSASTIEVLRSEDISAHPFIAKLGPDPLHEEVDATTFSRRLRDTSFSGRQVGTLLLEQSFAAGIGNYLRSRSCSSRDSSVREAAGPRRPAAAKAGANWSRSPGGPTPPAASPTILAV